MLSLPQNPTPSTPSGVLSKRIRAPAVRFSPSVTPKARRGRTTRSSSRKVQTPKPAPSRTGPKSRAIRSKLKSANRQHHIVMEETGGGTVVTLQAGIFEIFKALLLMFYKNPGTVLEGRAFKLGSPRDDNITHTTSIPVFSNDQAYTVNLYHSQSKILANGRNHAQFAQDFNLLINFIRSQQVIGGIPVDAEVNEVLKQHLEAKLEEDSLHDIHLDTHRGSTEQRASEVLCSEVGAICKPRLEGAHNKADKGSKEAETAKINPECKSLVAQQSNSSNGNETSNSNSKDPGQS